MTRSADRSTRLLVFTLVLFFVVSTCLVIWYTSRVANNLVMISARENAERYTEALSTVRSVYTSEVVGPASKAGITATHDYLQRDGTIPLPATLTIAIGDRIGQSDSGVEVALYSDYPFPFRSNRVLDEFQRAAIEQLSVRPNEPVSVIESGQLRYATADVMQQSCVQCHNSHPETPKRDWKAGDVRGVLEVSLPIATIENETYAGLRGLFAVMAGLLLVGLTALGLIIRKLIRDSAQLQAHAKQSDAALVEHQRMNQVLDQRSDELGRANAELESQSAALHESNRKLELRTAALSATHSSLANAIRRLTATSQAILENATQQKTGAHQQGHSVAKIVNTIGELSDTAQQTSAQAKQVAESSHRSSEVGNTGQRSVQEAIDAMSHVESQVESIADNITTMANHAVAIGKLTDTVTDIAEQTNVLALNAAIEAVRAGEQGRGFAVVAAEVKSLALKSKKATLHVNKILKEIQGATSATVVSLEKGVNSVRSASQVAAQAGITITTLRDTLSTSTESAERIHSAASTQADAVSQLLAAINDIQSVTQDNVQLNTRLKDAATELNQISTELELTIRSADPEIQQPIN